jgi:hypothetical protein
VHKTGQNSAKIYEIRIENGKKVRSNISEAKVVPKVTITESTDLTAIRKLAGLK